MKNLSISVLRNFPIGNPNRGRDGSPKTTPFGGVRRGRISSQSQNFAVRQALKESVPEMVSLRTRLLPALVEAAAQQYPNIAEESAAIKSKVKQLFGGEKDKEHTQILGDALMDVGCTDDYVLDLFHNQPQFFGRGVWIIDQLIGK